MNSARPTAYEYALLIERSQAELDETSPGTVFVYDIGTNMSFNIPKGQVPSLGERSYDCLGRVVCLAYRYYIARWVLD